MKTLTALFLLITAGSLNAQVLISEFRFNSNPVTTATVGPNATSVSSSAGSSTGGVGNTNGLNPKAQGEKQDINLTIPGSPTFDVRGIDININYRRNESDAYFFTRGSSLNFGMGGGQLFVTYRVASGNNSYTTVNSGNVYEIPSDDTYRTYRFVYNPMSGIGTIQVNGTVVWSNNGPDMRNLYWTGSGNVIVGQLMDGNGYNKTIVDNLKIYSVTAAVLPIQLLSFDAKMNQENTATLSWSTASEENNDYFSIERSSDETNWVEIKRVKGAGNSSQLINYETTDEQPKAGTQYYRLKQVDFDGKSETFKDVALQNNSTKKINISAYPNPTTGSFTLVSNEIQDAATTQILITNAMGNIIYQQTDSHEYKTNIDISSFPAGTYTVQEICDGQVARLLIVKN